MVKTKEIQFEDTLSRLEALACKLEGEEINLEAALAAFEEGVKLTRNTQTALQANVIQQKVWERPQFLKQRTVASVLNIPVEGRALVG